MKNKISVFAVCMFFISYNLSAQIISPRIGFGLSRVSTSGGTYKTDISPLLRFNIGGVYEHYIKDEFALQTGIIFEGKGFKETRNDNGFDFEVKNRIMYLVIPVGAKYIIKTNSLNIFANGGFYAGIGIGGKQILEGTYTSGSTSTILDDEQDFFDADGTKRLDFGIELGGGVIIPTKLTDVELGVLLSFGLTNVAEGTNVNAITSKNQAFKIYAAIPLKNIFKL